MILPRALISDKTWDEFVEGHSWGWFWHSTRWLRYCVEYREDALDLSFAVVDHGQIQALVPLIKEGDAFTMGGHPGAEPLLLVPPEQAPEEHAITYDPINNHVRRLAEKHGVRRWAVRSVPTRVNVADPPTVAWRDISWGTTVMDLRWTERSLWTGLRKSYRSLIHRAQREYDITVHAKPFAVELARSLHQEAAGRATRSMATWRMMQDWATDGYVLTALASKRGGASGIGGGVLPRGMAIAFRYKNAAYYASGATLDENISHALIWTLARTLKQGDIAHFEIGWGEREGDDEKARGVAFFKRGFGEEWRVIAQELDLA